MPLYLAAARRIDQPADRAALADTLAALERSAQLTGGRLVEALLLDADELALIIETPDAPSLARIQLEAQDQGVQIHARPALPRNEAEALDRAHRQRRAAAEPVSQQ